MTPKVNLIILKYALHIEHFLHLHKGHLCQEIGKAKFIYNCLRPSSSLVDIHPFRSQIAASIRQTTRDFENGVAIFNPMTDPMDSVTPVKK